MHQFAGQSPDDKIKFLFKVYDLDGKMISHQKLLWELVSSTLHFVKYGSFHLGLDPKALILAILPITSLGIAPCTHLVTKVKIRYTMR